MLNGLGALNPDNTYTVESGDYGVKVAQKLGCPSVQTLMASNPGKVTTMYAGQVLQVPPTCSAFVDPNAAPASAVTTPSGAQVWGGTPIPDPSALPATPVVMPGGLPGVSPAPAPVTPTPGPAPSGGGKSDAQSTPIGVRIAEYGPWVGGVLLVVGGAYLLMKKKRGTA
jgi:LysM repeat protein